MPRWPAPFVRPFRTPHTVAARSSKKPDAPTNVVAAARGNGKKPSRAWENTKSILGTIALVILAPMAAGLVQMAISRTREFEADRGGAEISGQPLWLASALQKIASAAHRIPNPTAERNPTSAHVFIVNPLSGLRMDKLFSTHPATEDRVTRLVEMSRTLGGTQSLRRESEPAAPWSGDSAPATRSGPWG